MPKQLQSTGHRGCALEYVFFFTAIRKLPEYLLFKFLKSFKHHIFSYSYDIQIGL